MKARRIVLLHVNLLLAIVMLASLGYGIWTAAIQPNPWRYLFPGKFDLFFSGRDLTLDEALRLARELDTINDGLDMPAEYRSQTGILMYVVEIAPYFADEGIATKVVFPLGAFELYPGMGNFHILGTCQVLNAFITLNIRFANPASRWYTSASYFPTIVHETGHAQGIVSFGDPLSEPATQLATTEVLAAMSRDRNSWAFPALTRELQGYVEDYALYKALETGQIDLYREYFISTADNEFERGAFDRMMYDWKDDMEQMKYILYAYGSVPFQLLQQSMASSNSLTPELAAVPNPIHRFYMNDTKWVIQHLQALAEDYPKLPAPPEE